MGEGNGEKKKKKNKTSIDMINASHKSEDILSLIDNRVDFTSNMKGTLSVSFSSITYVSRCASLKAENVLANS